VKHFASPGFWSSYELLPEAVQKIADKNFEILKTNPRHPSICLKKAGNFWSARVGIQYRALAKERAEGLVWVWIGHHSEYDQWLKTQ
jgi:hypothetical protein